MMPPRSVLAAVDFSEPSRVALEFAARLANQSQATLHVLHVQHPLLVAAARDKGIEVIREAREELAGFTAKTTAVSKRSFATRHHVVSGDAARTICDIAVREQADVIVIGMHGISGTAHAPFGSTAEGVLLHSDTPVFAVPDSWAPPTPSAEDLTGIGPVIVGVETSCTAMAGAAAAAQLARVLQTTVHAVHVVPGLTVLERWRPHADAIVEQQIATARREIAAALSGLTPPHEFPLTIATGSVPERLAAAAAMWPGRHPVLVLGRHARDRRRGVPGATAYRVLAQAKVPVLVSCVAEDYP